MEDMFVNEDISKPENRANLALFHLQMNNEFHSWFCERLGVSDSCVIYPTKNIKGNRPDFIIKYSEKIIGYIEVELGNENNAQLINYRHNHENDETKIFSITGKQIHQSDLGLDEIADFLLTNIIPVANSQTKLSAQYLVNIIQTYTQGVTSSSRSLVSEEVMAMPFINRLLNELIVYKPDENRSKAEPSKYYCDTNGTQGFSFRVYSPISKASKSVSLFFITNGRDYISFNSAEHYRQYLTHKSDNDVNSWIMFITNELYLPIELGKRQEISISSLSTHFDNLIKNIKPLI